MTFQELPEDWPTRSLSDPHLARDVVDLVVSLADRERGGIAFLLCGPGGRLVQPVFVAGATTPDDATAERCVADAATEVLVTDAVTSDREPGSVLFAIVRAHGGVTDTDRSWHQRVIEVCREAGVRLLGVHLVTLDRVVTLPSEVRVGPSPDQVSR
jgi:hypothetical protein